MGRTTRSVGSSRVMIVISRAFPEVLVRSCVRMVIAQVFDD
jgi:hypothetical protein